jgi:hypothetical protein
MNTSFPITQKTGMFSEKDLPLGGGKCFVYVALFISLNGGNTSCFSEQDLPFGRNSV